MTKAHLIGDSSSGMTAVEIYEGDELVWSYTWFKDGCGSNGYLIGLIDACDCMRRCADWSSDYEISDRDDDGPILYNSGATTGVIMEYDTATGWAIGDDARGLGQSEEILDACMSAGLVPRDDEHNADSDVVVAIIKHILTPE